MELDPSPRVILFLFSRENWRAAERPNTAFCMDGVVGLDSSSLTLLFTDLAEDRCQASCEFHRSGRVAVSFCLTQPSVSHCWTADFSNKMPW